MSKIVAILLASAILEVWGQAEQVSFYNGGNGKSYIAVNEDLASFSFSVDGYSSSKLNGRVGYFTFDGKAGKKELQAAAQHGTLIAAGQNAVSLENVASGTQIGFYLADAHGNLNTAYQFTGDPAIGNLAIEFKGNEHHSNGKGKGHSSHGNGWGFGHMESGWMKITAIEAMPTGRPLPGYLASLLAGMLAVGAVALKKFRHPPNLQSA